MPTYLGDRIRTARKAAGMTQRQLAEQLGVKNTTISNWEKNQANPDPDTIQNLCYVLQVEANYFFRETESKLPANLMPMPRTRRVPLVGTIACGTPILATENVEEEIDIPEGIRAGFALRCKGDSMVGADIQDGDIVYIQETPEVLDGQIAAVLIGEEATLKRVYYDRSEGMMTLLAENRKYPPLVYQGEALNQMRILGRAVGLTRRLV